MMIFEEPGNVPYATMNELIRLRVDKSKLAMRDAENNYNMGSYNLTINRLYYAMFYMISALLLKFQLYGKTHKGILILFSEHFVKTGFFTKSETEVYEKLFTMRMEGDYDDFVLFSKEQVEPWFEKVRAFMQVIERKLESEN